MINSTNTHIRKHQQCYNNTVRRMCYNLLTETHCSCAYTRVHQPKCLFHPKQCANASAHHMGPHAVAPVAASKAFR